VKTTFRARGARAGLQVMLLSLVAAWPLVARAYRPFNSTDAAVAAKGEVEVELGPLEYLKEGSDRMLVVPSLILNWGFADRWEAVLEGRNVVALGSEVQERVRVDDIAFSLKGVLREGSLQEKHGVSIATELSVLLPTVNGDDQVGAEGALIVSQRWTDLTVHVNGAAQWSRAHNPGAFGGIILEGHDAWTVRPVAEVWLARTGSVNTTELRAGLTWGFSVGFPR